MKPLKRAWRMLTKGVRVRRRLKRHGAIRPLVLEQRRQRVEVASEELDSRMEAAERQCATAFEELEKPNPSVREVGVAEQGLEIVLADIEQLLANLAKADKSAERAKVSAPFSLKIIPFLLVEKKNALSKLQELRELKRQRGL